MTKIKIFIKCFFAGIGIISSIMTIVWGIWGEKIKPYVQGHEFEFIVGVISVILLLSFLTILKKNKISFKLTQNVKISIYYNDLFESSGVIVIPFNDYFEGLVLTSPTHS